MASEHEKPMTISKEAVEAAARAMCDDGCNWDNKLPGHRKTMWLDRAEIALKAALPFLALRPAPSQSDETAAVEKLVNLPHELERSGYNREFFDKRMLAAILVFAATVRVKAALAGAAAEREWNKPNIDAIREAKDEDLRTLRAAKDREIAAFAGERLAYCTRIAALREALQAVDTMCSGGSHLEKSVIAIVRAALSAPPAPDPAEAMRAALTEAEKWLCRYYTGEPCNHNSVHDAIVDVRAALKGNGEGLISAAAGRSTPAHQGGPSDAGSDGSDAPSA